MEYAVQKIENTKGGHLSAVKYVEARAEEIKATDKLLNTNGRYTTRKQYNIDLKSQNIAVNIEIGRAHV